MLMMAYNGVDVSMFASSYGITRLCSNFFSCEIYESTEIKIYSMGNACSLSLQQEIAQ